MKRVVLLLVAGLYSPRVLPKDSTKLIPTPGGRPEGDVRSLRVRGIDDPGDADAPACAGG